jgi:glutaconate CoA-transferase subunit B
MSADSYSAAELIAILLARELRDGEVGVAAVSALSIAACLLAQRRHAPSLTFLTTTGAVNPKPRALYHSPSDARYLHGAEAIGDFYEVFEYCEHGVDVMIYSGMQIDRFGNLNLTWIDADGRRVRGSGLANVSHAATARRWLIYKTTHTRRDLVERVDFRTAPGHIDGPGARARLGLPGGGPTLCVTPLCTFDFDPATAAMRLRSLHPGVTFEEVAARTGFAVARPAELPTTPAPSAEELALLREIDPTGVLRGEN